MRTGNFEKAAKLYEEARTRDAQMSEAMFGLATALKRVGKTEKSKAMVQRFRHLHENEQEAIRKTYALRQDYLSRPDAKRALTLSRHHRRTRNLESALAYAWVAVRSGGGSTARLCLARTLVRTGRFQSAAVHYRRVLANEQSAQSDRESAESELRDLITKHARKPR